MPNAEQVKNKVLRMLMSHMDVRMDDDGDILIRLESAVCWVSVNNWGEPSNDGRDTVVQVRAPIIWEAKRTPALYEWVATEGQKFMIGRVACNSDSDASLTNVFFEHTVRIAWRCTITRQYARILAGIGVVDAGHNQRRCLDIC